MRELLLKNYISPDKKRSELLLTEYFETEHSVLNFEKKTVYKVKETLEFTDIFDLELFLSQKKKEEIPPQTYIVKSRDKRKGRIKVLYKTVGIQHAVLGDKVFVVEVSQFVRKIVEHKKEKLFNTIA